MATKKQKRALGEARQRVNLAESIASGLRAQKRDQDRREKAKREQEQEAIRVKKAKSRDDRLTKVVKATLAPGS